MKTTPARQAAIYQTFHGEEMIEAGHPPRPIERIVDAALTERFGVRFRFGGTLPYEPERSVGPKG